MTNHHDIIQALRQSLEQSPDNLAIRKHLAHLLLENSDFLDAEKEYQRALEIAPRDTEIQFGLARAFQGQNKTSPALVIVEELMKNYQPAPDVFLLAARLYIQTEEPANASRTYYHAIKLNPALKDPDLERQIARLPSNRPAPGTEPDEDFDPLLRQTASNDPEEILKEMETPKTTFADVGGMDAVKEEIRLKIIHPLNHPDIYAAYGKPIGGGVLLYGPPGCGKTHLARATAGEVKANFISVGLHDVLNMYIGESERNLHELFEMARIHRPCVLFFDEVDALGANRTDMKRSAGRHLINQFLAELDGLDASNEGVLILAATNAPWHLDAAFRRPGRFDRILFVPPPDTAARTAILDIMLKGKPVDNIDANKIANKTENFSGADFKAVVDVAIEAKLKEALATGTPSPLTTKDILDAVKRIKPTTKEWFGTARNYALYANDSGLYDEILAYLKMKR